MSRWETDRDGRVQTWVPETGAGVPVLRPGGAVPDWAAVEGRLPELVWEGHPEAEDAWMLGWRLYWDHLRPPEPGPFAGTYLDSAFNGAVFLWDAAFAQRFALYGRRVLELATLDGFYASQAEDGWICRTLRPNGLPAWERHDPSSTGPNVLAWTELLLAERTGDVARLAHVLPALLAYHRWTRRYRTWPDGGYWTSGWGSGMDALPRLPEGVEPNFEHGGVTWVDATLQALLSARSLLRIAELVGADGDFSDLRADADRLQELAATRLWDDGLGAFVDLLPDGSSAGALHVGSYWALLAGGVPPERQARLVAHLSDPATLGRPFPVPALSAAHPRYRADGGYWMGAVWTPTTLMVLDGLQLAGESELAHRLAVRHVDLVAATAASTGTIWENWSPEGPAAGYGARPDFVGWGAASPITVALEHALGIRCAGEEVHWDVRLTERHGVRRLPVGATATVDLLAAARGSAGDRPAISARTDSPVTLRLTWPGGSEVLRLEPEGTGT